MSVKFTFKESNQTSRPKEQSNSSSDENQNHQSDANSITQENFQLNDQESESVDGGGGGTTAAAEQTNQNIPIADPLERSSVGSNEARDEVGLDTKRSLQITLSVSPYARQFGVFVRPYVML